MDLSFTAEQEAFRAEARAWLDAHVPAGALPSMDTAEGFEAHRDWERTLHRGGWGTVAWPTEFGGRGADLVEWLIFDEEYHASGAPGRVNQNGLFLLAPTLMEYGSDVLKRRFLPPMAAGDEIWAQGWSEPGAGSDLAALRSRAERDGDEWVLNGQKTWCSRGAYADWMFGLFRSDPASQRHRGLTFILVPLDAPGVTVRPIRQLDGEAGFAEVFLTDVRVPVANTLGEEGQGWRVTMSTAGFERGVLLRPPGRFLATAGRLRALCDELGDDVPAGLRDEVDQCVLEAEAYRLATYWTVSHLLEGGTIGAEASMNKIYWSEMDIHLHETALALLGARGMLGGDAPDALGGGRWLDGYLFSLAGPIYAGTNEIQRNIVAERVLGLPRAR
jgi:alkylation response protein AidB-like acyl-CoA dehydrogenase